MSSLKPGFLADLPSIFPVQDGRQSPARVDFDADVPCVLDLSRIAQKGILLRGSLAVTHVGAGTIREDVTVRSLFAAMTPSPSPDQFDCWLMRLFGWNTGGLSGNQTVGVVGGQDANSFQSIDRAVPVAIFNASVPGTVELIAGQGVPMVLSATSDFTGGFRNPIRMRPSTDAAGIYFASVSTGATAVRLGYEVWIGRKGATPPGHA